MKKIIEVTNIDRIKLKKLYEKANYHQIYEEYFCPKYSGYCEIHYIKFDNYIVIKIKNNIKR